MAALLESELDTLQALLDSLSPRREPLDVVMIDGYLCGVLLQPKPVPAGFALDKLAALVHRRYVELNAAISRREWFDPWVYQLDDDASPSETVMPWVAGFATAMDAFPMLMQRHEAELLEPLATLYRHFDPEDLEDADELIAEIETLEPPQHLAEAVEDLVRSVLLMADVSRPNSPGQAPGKTPGNTPRRLSARTDAARERPAPGPRSRSGRPGGPRR